MGDGMVQKNLFFHEGWVDGGGCIDCKRYWGFAGVGMVGGGSWAVWSPLVKVIGGLFGLG